MTTSYQDVLLANGAVASWSLTEAAGLDFVPWLGGTHLTGTGVFTYQQAGPFAASLALQLAVGATLRFPFSVPLFPPVTTECWFKLSTITPASNEILFYEGDNSLNGAGLYVASNSHIHTLRGGSGDTDTGVIWPNTNWHLVQLAAPDATHLVLFLDGIQVFSQTIGAPLAPSPNGQGWLSDDSAYANKITALIAYPALYQQALTGARAFATFLASTDPTQALNYILSATGGSALAPLLTQILSSVRKTY